MTWKVGRRLAAALSIVTGTLVMTGCAVRGDVNVNEDATVTVDVTVTHSSTSDVCTNPEEVLSDFGLSRDMIAADRGQVACRITGTTTREAAAVLPLGRGDGRYFISLPASRFKGGDQLTDIDFTISFPGPILETVGASSVSGSEARFMDAGVVNSSGFVVVASDSQGPHPVWGVAALAGAVGAAAGAGVALLVMRGADKTGDMGPTSAGLGGIQPGHGLVADATSGTSRGSPALPARPDEDTSGRRGRATSPAPVEPLDGPDVWGPPD